ncbi:DUF3997 domain-containing protein [Solibacillus cecembensis]|uniref:DUF3997 domain-containing protein n=1 Tax=Solibacillus cecembensis TaxID=459347 RepID=UPI003D06930A
MFNKHIFRYLVMVFISLIMLTGCAGLADYSLDLPGNYSIVRTSAHQVKVAPKISESHWGSDVIPTKVTEVAWDDNYILAKQLGLVNDPKSSNGYQIPNNDDVHFWILEIKSGEVFGPLDEVNFVEKKNEFDISESVILKKIEDLK